MSRLYDRLEIFDCLRFPLRITENSAALSIGDFLRQFKFVECRDCLFDCILRFNNGKAQFYITDLQLVCDNHARLFTEAMPISTPSRSTNLCTKQSCWKFLRFVNCCKIVNAQTFKDLGAVFRNCKHLKTIRLVGCGGDVCELLDQIPNPSTCSLMIGDYSRLSFNRAHHLLTLVAAEKLAGVLPRFNVTALYLDFVDCCAAAVNKLVCSIPHKTLQRLKLRGISLTPAAAVALGRSLSEMWSFRELELTGVDGSILQVEEMEALFGGINQTFPALKWLTLSNFNTRGSLAPLTKRVHLFPNLYSLDVSCSNVAERDFRGLLESLRSIPNLKHLFLYGNSLGSKDRVQSIVQQALPQVNLMYW